jgi:lysophospholipase
MGGAIGMTYLEQFPNDFNAAAFSSPMLGLNPPSCAVVKILEGDKPEYVLGAGKYNDDYNSFEGNTLTGNEIRFDRMVDAFNKNPKAKLGGASYQWVHKSCQQFEIVFDNIDKIQTPFILFSAENEQIVNPNAHQQFIDAAKKLGKNCKAYKVENAQHELFIEKDTQRIETVTEILDFYKES